MLLAAHASTMASPTDSPPTNSGMPGIATSDMLLLAVVVASVATGGVKVVIELLLLVLSFRSDDSRVAIQMIADLRTAEIDVVDVGAVEPQARVDLRELG